MAPAGGAVRRIGFAYNPTSDPAVEVRERASGWAELHGIDSWAAPAADREALHRELPGTDILVVLGGDGTFLRAGVQHGERLLALNDVVIARGSLARVVRLDTSIDSSHLASFVADGLVVASPTGSTGYSFSAGGPILGPTARNLVVTPIAGYLTTIRSVVVGAEAVVRCRIVDAHEALVSVDGREDIPLAVGDVVEVRSIARPVRLVEPEGSLPFWDLVRRKVELLPS